MRLFVLLFVLMFQTSFAGECLITGSSAENWKMRFADGYKEKQSNVQLIDCIRLVEERLGSTINMKNVLRDEHRIITTIRYSFVDEKISSSGSVDLKED